MLILNFFVKSYKILQFTTLHIRRGQFQLGLVGRLKANLQWHLHEITLSNFYAGCMIFMRTTSSFKCVLNTRGQGVHVHVPSFNAE